MTSTLVCATDFSRGASRAVETAAGLAQRLGARLELLHVVTPVISHVPPSSFLDEIHLALRNDAEGKLEELARSLAPRVSTTWRVVEGFAVEQILARAKELSAELIVLGTTSEGPLARVLLGSTANRVVRASPIPVVLVPMAPARTATATTTD